MNQYITLLRGINVSGKNKISMAVLKKELEDRGFCNVITYINSGNIIYSLNKDNTENISNTIHTIIQEVFNLDIIVFTLTRDELLDILAHAPDFWGTPNTALYDNIIFVIPPATPKELLADLGEINITVEQTAQYKNVIYWSFTLADYKKSAWYFKTANADIHHKLTIRTAGTLHKIAVLCHYDTAH